MNAIIKNNKIFMEFEIGKVDKDLINFLSSIEISQYSEASEDEINKLAQEIKKEWWNNNKEKLLNEDCN